MPSVAVLFLAATVTCGTRTMPTYPYSDPDPVPATSEKRYPYPRFDGSSVTNVPVVWKTVVLESDRLRIEMFPEIGGKIWRATDKVSGRDFIYGNDVVKFRNIAMCGPWTSGGVEFNFGIIGHSPTTSVPVRWCVRTNDDSSVSYFCGNRERICGTVWQVEVRLRDGEDFFTTGTRWNNASGLNQPYYQWMNAAFSVRDDPEFVFPGAGRVGHEGDAHPWPFDEKGRDLRRYRDNGFGHNKSYHVVAGDPRFFAVWWRTPGVGAYHENEYGEKYGRKIWLWALSREGGIWEDLLTDTAGQYMELQSGRAFNQPRGKTYATPFKHPTFTAGRTDAFAERWGVVRSREELAVRERRPVLTPRPTVAPADFDWTTAYGHFLRAEQALRELDMETADDEVRQALAKEPNLLPALDLAAEMAVRRGDYVRADAHLMRALSINTYDPAANYLEGLVYEATGRDDDALERFGLAAYSLEYRTAARCAMGRIRLRRGEANGALKEAEVAMAADPLSIEALRLRIAVTRRLGDAVRADRYEEEFRAVWPTVGDDSHWLVSCGLRQEAVAAFRAAGDFLGRLGEAFLMRDAPALAELAKAEVEFAFPNRREQIPALDWACANSADWKFRYLRAVLAAALGDRERAVRLLEDCGDVPQATFHLYRAQFRTGERRLADLRQAARAGDSWRVGKELADHFLSVGDSSAAKKTLEDYLGRYPKCNPLEIRYAQALLNLGEYRACVDFLSGVSILPSEFGDNATGIWQAAWKALGDERMAQTYPENLGSGAPYSAEDDVVTKKQRR